MISGVKLLQEESCPGLEQLEVHIAGQYYEEDCKLVQQLGLDSYFQFLGMLQKDELDREYRGADIFIVVDSPQIKNVFFPSKLMDYFYYRRPILGITPLTGGTADELRASGNTIIKNGDIDSIKQFLKQILSNGVQSLTYDAEYYQRFSPERISAQFMEIVQSVL